MLYQIAATSRPFVEIENIDETRIAFGRAVKFMHARNAETVFELHPYIGAQAIAQNARHIMRGRSRAPAGPANSAAIHRYK